MSYHDDVSNDLFSSPCSISTFVSISCLYSSPHSDFHIAANVEAGYTLLAFIIEEEEEDFFFFFIFITTPEGHVRVHFCES